MKQKKTAPEDAIACGRSAGGSETRSDIRLVIGARTRDHRKLAVSYLNFLFAKCDLRNNVQTCRLVWLRILQVLGLENILVFFAVNTSSAMCGRLYGGVGGDGDGTLPKRATWVTRVATNHVNMQLRWKHSKGDLVPCTASSLPCESLVVDIWRHLVRDGLLRMHQKGQRACGARARSITPAR